MSGLAVIAVVLGFVLLQAFGARGYCWRHPDAEPNMRNDLTSCRELGGTAVDAVLSYAGASLIAGALLAVIGALAWAFRPSVRSR